jgi:hypothetical protein
MARHHQNFSTPDGGYISKRTAMGRRDSPSRSSAAAEKNPGVVVQFFTRRRLVFGVAFLIGVEQLLICGLMPDSEPAIDARRTCRAQVGLLACAAAPRWQYSSRSVVLTEPPPAHASRFSDRQSNSVTVAVEHN